MASKIPVSSSPAVSKYREKLQTKDTGEIKESSKIPGTSRMQLRNKKVLVTSSTKPRVRTQTVTKSKSTVKTDPANEDVQPAPKTPEPLPRVSQGAAVAEVTQELSRTITKKPASLAKKERKCPAGRIPSLVCSTPPHVHNDFPEDKGAGKPSKLKTPTSTRVFRESKQFSPAHSPQVTPKRLSLLHVTLDKENTPPTKQSPNIMTARPSPTLNSAQQLNQSSGKPKSQLPRRLKAQRTSKSSKEPKRADTYSISSTSSNDGDRTINSVHKEGEVRPVDEAGIATGTYSLEKKDLNITRDVTRFEPLTQSTPKENVPPVITDEAISQAKIYTVLEKKDSYVTRDMTGFQPLTQSTPIDPEPPVNIEQVIPLAATKFVPNKKNLPEAVKSYDAGYETSSVNCPSFIPKSSPQEENAMTNTVQISSNNVSTVSSHKGSRGNSSNEGSVSAEALTLCPIVTHVTSSIVLPSAPSYTPSVLNISHAQITSQSSTINVPSNRHQSGYPQERSYGQVAMCSMHYAGQQLVPVSAHVAPLCAYRPSCHTPVTSSQGPVVQSTLSKPCVCLFPDSQPDVLPTTQMRPSAFADPSLAHLIGKHIRKTSVVRAVTTQPLLLVSQSEDLLDAAADLEVERLTQGSPQVAVDPHRMVVNPIASGLDGDFRKYTFQPIHVPSRRVLQNEGSAFRRILIC